MNNFSSWIFSEPKRSRLFVLLVCLAIGFALGWTIGHFGNGSCESVINC